LGQRVDRAEDGNQSHFNSMSDQEVPGYRPASRPPCCGHIRDTFTRPRSVQLGPLYGSGGMENPAGNRGW
jgi:hypothetical protein